VVFFKVLYQHLGKLRGISAAKGGNIAQFRSRYLQEAKAIQNVFCYTNLLS
jgi:hypothetical protein